MNVALLAHTVITADAESILEADRGVYDADFLAELAGRDCYQSFDRPNPETRENIDYLGKNLIGKQHFSVLEHASVTLRFTGVSRSFTHELVRHRHLSFSQLSQRYVDIDDAQYVVPPAIRDWPDHEERQEMLDQLNDVWDRARLAYGVIEATLHDAYDGNSAFMSRALSRKQAREAARSVLPNATETIIDVTGNHRAWREFLNKRLSPQADAEIREVAIEVLNVVRNIAPHTYQDFSVT